MADGLGGEVLSGRRRPLIRRPQEAWREGAVPSWVVTPQLGAMTPAEIIAILVRAGYRVARQKGSHVRLEREGSTPLTLALHSRSLPPGLVRKILIKDAQLTEDEIRDLR